MRGSRLQTAQAGSAFPRGSGVREGVGDIWTESPGSGEKPERQEPCLPQLQGEWGRGWGVVGAGLMG